MKSSKWLLAVFLLFGFIATPALAQFSPYPSADIEPWVRFILGNPEYMPSEWLALPNFFYFVILPVIAIIAVVYGILTDIRLFRSSSVRLVISVAMACMTLPTGWLIGWVYYMYQFNAIVAVVAFGIVFFIGIILWGAGSVIGIGYRMMGEAGEAKAAYQSIKDLYNQKEQLRVREIALAQAGKLTDDEKIKIGQQKALINAKIHQLKEAAGSS